MKSSFKSPTPLKVIGFLLFFGLLGLGGWFYSEKFFHQKPALAPSPSSIKKVIYLHIAGEVERPGLYKMKPQARLGELVEKAGGLTAHADISEINLASRMDDGEKIIIPAKKGFFERVGIGKGPEETFINPPIEIEKAE